VSDVDSTPAVTRAAQLTPGFAWTGRSDTFGNGANASFWSTDLTLFNLDEPVRLACALALVGLGAWFARDAGRAVGPALARHVDVGTAGTIGFILRLVLLVAALLVALRIAGLTPRTLAVGGAVTAIVLGLAAQSTIGNLFAGLLLLSVQPFRVGDRVRLQAGNLAGVLEGTVSQLGLLYVTLTQGDDVILVPNNTVVAAAIVPLKNPGGVDLRARLRPGIKPSEVQRMIEETVQVPTRESPQIELEEVDDSEVIMRITATPQSTNTNAVLSIECCSWSRRATCSAALAACRSSRTGRPSIAPASLSAT